MRTRLRAPNGTSTLTLADDATIGDLLRQIQESTSISSFDIKFGYPPKPLLFDPNESSKLLKDLDVKLGGEQLTISPRDVGSLAQKPTEDGQRELESKPPVAPDSFSFGNIGGGASPSNARTKSSSSGPISLKPKKMDEEVPELPLPERGATLVLRVMPDDNSCLFRAFGTAVLPGDDASMPELRALVAAQIQAEPLVYSKVVLEQEPDDYCRWIQTADAWGGAIEMGILSKHFEIEICSIDVQSLRVDRFNEGAPTRCILVYSGIHYDTMVQSPSDPPHDKADSPPEFDRRVWDADDDDILVSAQELCRKLQSQHYYTDTGGMAIKCEDCGTIIYGQAQAQTHAQQTGHYDMAEVR